MLLQKTVALDGSVQPAADKFGIATRWTFDDNMGRFSAFRNIDAKFCRDGVANQNRHFFGKLRIALIGRPYDYGRTVRRDQGSFLIIGRDAEPFETAIKQIAKGNF